MHAANVGWLQARRVHSPPKAPFSRFTQADVVPKLAFDSPEHTSAVAQTYAPEYATRFITVKVSPKDIETHQPFHEQPWTLADLLFVTSSTWQNKNGYSPNTWKGLLLMLPTSSVLSSWNKPLAVKLARQQTKNTLIQLETQAYLLQYKYLNW